MSIFNVIGMIPKGGKYAKSVVNFVRKAPEHWPKFKEAIKQIDDLLKQGKLKLDGKQKTNFEANKNILKIHEKVTKKVEVPPSVTKKYPPFNVSKEDFTKGWTPTLHERSNLRNVYKDLNPPASKYTKEMEAIDEELDALAFGGEKYEGLSSAEKAAIFKKLQAEMKKLIYIAKKEDMSTLSLSQINKKSHDLQKRIRLIADNPNIKGTVYEGPKRDMIKAIYDSESSALTNARQAITKKNSELKYGKKYPVLDPENDAFIVLGLDSSGNPIKISRFTGKFSATKDKTTGELTSGEGTSFYDKWNAETNQMRKKGEEVFHETLNRDGKVIMSNPGYKLPKTENMELQTEFYTDLSTSDLAKKGYELKQIDMIVKGRAVRKYLEKTKSKDTSISMHEQTSSNEIGSVLEDLYNRGDDIYKMSMKEWVTKIPEYFAEGGRIGFKRGLSSAPWLRGRSGSGNIKAWRGKEGWKEAQKLAEKFNLKNKASATGIIAALLAATEAGTIGVDEVLKMLGKQESDLYKPSDFYRIWKNYQAMKEALKRNKARKTRGGPEMQEDYYSGYYKEHMPELTWRAIHPGDEEKMSSSKEMRDYVYPTEKRNEHATGGVSNLFRERQGYRAGTAIELVKGARWLIRMLKEMSDDMIFGRAQFAKMVESMRMKYFKETQAAIKHLESGGSIPENLLQTMRADKRFQNLTVSRGGDKDFQEIQEVVLESKFPKDMRKFMGKPLKTEDFVEIDLMEFKKTLPKDLLDKVNALPVEDQTPLLLKFKQAFDTAKKGGIESGVDVLQEQMLTDFIPKGKPHATGGLIPGYATGGVSNLFRRR